MAKLSLRNVLLHCVLVHSAMAAMNCSADTFTALLPSNATVKFAYTLAANSTFDVPSYDLGFPSSPTGLPALCAAEIEMAAPGNTTFGFGLFLPDSWNGRFLAVGNSGFAGGINWLDMGAGVQYGFATLSTDTGHQSDVGNASWAYNAPEVVTNWGYRAMHESVVQGKAVVDSYYGVAATYSYYSGCSTGGRQGLREVELFPDDFDGVVAGAPAWWTNHLQLWNMKVGLYNLPTTADYHIPTSLISVIGAEVLKQCDGQDGLVDTVISDPTRCNFRPEALLCNSTTTNATDCLTDPQIDTLYHLYNDWVEANQTFIFPHLELGSEAQWDMAIGADEPSSLGTDYVKYMLGLGPDWQWQNWDPSIITLSEQINPGNATASDFNISPFAQKGGKLLHYHGYADGSIATGSSIYYYNHVLRTLKPMGIELDDFYRFFLVPGMQHCAGTPSDMNAPWYFAGGGQASALGSNVHSVPGFVDPAHDVLLAMMAWVENGTTPDQVVATVWENQTTHDTVLRQRPLCMYPKQAQFNGSGDANEAASWVCDIL